MVLKTRSPSFAKREAGFGLVEIVVSMFLIGIIAIAFLPLLIQTMIVSANNATVAFATQLVNTELNKAKGLTSCGALETLQAASIALVSDSRNIELQPSRSMGACPSTLPGAVPYSAKVIRIDTGETLASADTLIFVSAD